MAWTAPSPFWKVSAPAIEAINSRGIGSGVELSFGGIRHGGFGREKGPRALDEYSALRTTTVRVGPRP